jgi:putative hydrolase of the HAD superfamily
MNVVFDLGGVVFTWQPRQIIGRVFKDPEIQEKIRTEIFAHPDWEGLDRGVLDKDEAIERGAMRTGLSRSEISKLMWHIPLSLIPIKDTVKLIHSVKRSGNKVFVLSNMHLSSIEHIEREYSFWDVFDGKVISCRVHMVKPEEEIFTYLLDEYGLIVNETIFIDDTDLNVNTALRLGFSAIKFNNPSQCEDELRSIGCL